MIANVKHSGLHAEIQLEITRLADAALGQFRHPGLHARPSERGEERVFRGLKLRLVRLAARAGALEGALERVRPKGPRPGIAVGPGWRLWRQAPRAAFATSWKSTLFALGPEGYEQIRSNLSSLEALNCALEGRSIGPTGLSSGLPPLRLRGNMTLAHLSPLPGTPSDPQ